MRSRSIVLVTLLASLVTSGFSQNRYDAASYEAARKEQAAQAAIAVENAEKLDQAADAIIEELRAAVSAEAPAKTYDVILQKISALILGNGQRYPSNPKLEATRTFATHWQDYLFALGQNKFEQTQQALRQLIQEASGIPIIPRSEIMARQEKLADQIIAADQAFVDPLIKHFEETLAKADSAANLQPFLQEIIAAQSTYARTFPNQGTSALPLISQLRNFATRLQDGLSAYETGNISGAKISLTNLFDDRSSFNDIAAITRSHRARILNKLNTPRADELATASTPPPGSEGPSVDALTADNLEELAAFLRKNSQRENVNTITCVDHLINVRNALREHLRANITTFMGGPFTTISGKYAEPLNRIRQRLLVQSIKSDLNSNLVPEADENSTVYLKRIIQTALATKDWYAAHNALTLQRDIVGTSSPDERSAIPGLLALIMGIKQEAVGQYAFASGSYQQALGYPSTLLPIKELEMRMHNLKDKVPQETTAASVKESTIFDDARTNIFLMVGLLAGILGTLGIQRIRNR